MEESYDDLVGKELLYGNEVGIVIGCDFDVGITVVNKEDKTDFLFCVHGPLSKVYRDPSYLNLNTYATVFNYYVEGIKKGKMTKDLHVHAQDTGEASAEVCPFGQ